MSCIKHLTPLAVAALAVCSVHAEEGQLRSKLLDALRASQKGECPKSIMSPMLQDTCERQMPSLGNALAAKGAVRSAEFKGNQPTPAGPCEVYRVNFDNGSMAWMVSAGPDGKLVVLWSSGQ